jgi:hypothetical protein
VAFASVTEQIDTTTAGGELIFHIFAPLPASNASYCANVHAQS